MEHEKSKTKDLEPEYRPDEKFLSYGPEALSDSELLAIIIRTGNTEYNSVELSRKILSLQGTDHISILNIFNYTIPELLKINGIGKVKAIQIKALAELSKRISQSQARSHLSFNDSGKIAEYYMEQLRHQNRETVVLLMLNCAGNLIHEEVISTGTVNVSLISTREIFILAMKYEAVMIVLLHNHPSGNPEPSMADIQVTEEIENAGLLINIRLVDHIIIGDNDYYSFRERGLIHEQ